MTAASLHTNSDHKREVSALKRAIAKADKEPGAALKMLIATGMYTRAGKLKKQFR